MAQNMHCTGQLYWTGPNLIFFPITFCTSKKVKLERNLLKPKLAYLAKACTRTLLIHLVSSAGRREKLIHQKIFSFEACIISCILAEPIIILTKVNLMKWHVSIFYLYRHSISCILHEMSSFTNDINLINNDTMIMIL